MFDIRKFGSYISKLRKEADMTQSMLADKLNLTRQSVSSYENGDSFPDISILVLISQEFGVTIDDLIKSGEPTKTEEILLKVDAKKSNIPEEIFKNSNISKEILNIAPLLKPSILEKVAKGFKKHDIDISSLVTLAEYLTDEAFLEVLEKTNFDTLDKDILEKFMPFLDDVSKSNLFAKIIDGELDYHFLEIYLPYVDPYYIHSQVEAAVIAGTLEWDALKLLGKMWEDYFKKEQKEKLAADLKGLIEKFMPSLQDVYKNNLIEKVLNGEIDYGKGYFLLYSYMPYVDPYYLNEPIEKIKVEKAALSWTALELDALKILREVWHTYLEKQGKEN